MSHPCHDQWRMSPLSATNRIVRLDDLVKKEDLRQAANGFTVGGWAYWLQPEDFARFRDAYLEICRALNAATVLPGESAPPPPPPPQMLPIPALTSEKLGTWSQHVLDVLAADEIDQDDAGLFIHPGHGMHGWLGTGAFDPVTYDQAERLLTSMRNALDR